MMREVAFTMGLYDVQGGMYDGDPTSFLRVCCWLAWPDGTPVRLDPPMLPCFEQSRQCLSVVVRLGKFVKCATNLLSGTEHT